MKRRQKNIRATLKKKKKKKKEKKIFILIDLLLCQTHLKIGFLNKPRNINKDINKLRKKIKTNLKYKIQMVINKNKSKIT